MIFQLIYKPIPAPSADHKGRVFPGNAHAELIPCGEPGKFKAAYKGASGQWFVPALTAGEKVPTTCPPDAQRVWIYSDTFPSAYAFAEVI